MPANTQNFASHTRFHPPFHFILLPIFFLNLILCVVWLVRQPGLLTAWCVVMGLALFIMLGLTRMYPVKVQDRLIRLEERLRLASILPEPLKSRIGELTIDQLVGLRFASDAELPSLVERTLRENLKRKQIKQAIVIWRSDDWRV